MKVICEEAVYCFPEKRSINLLADNMYKDRLNACRNIKKKRKKPIVRSSMMMDRGSFTMNWTLFIFRIPKRDLNRILFFPQSLCLILRLRRSLRIMENSFGRLSIFVTICMNYYQTEASHSYAGYCRQIFLYCLI